MFVINVMQIFFIMNVLLSNKKKIHVVLHRQRINIIKVVKYNVAWSALYVSLRKSGNYKERIAKEMPIVPAKTLR